MKKLVSIFASLALVLGLMPFAAFAWADTGNAQEPPSRLENLGTPGTDYVDGEAIACVRGGAAALYKELGVDQASQGSGKGALLSFSAREKEVDRIVTLANNGLAPIVATSQDDAAAPEQDYELVLVSTFGQSVPDFIEKIEGFDCVAFADPNYICEPTYTLADAQGEPYYPYEWYLDKDSIPVNWDTNAEQTYSSAAFASSDDVVVAVMDSGVDYTHPDLAASMWDEGENYPTLTAMGGGKYGINTSGEGLTADPMDTLVGHGTHCASTIASTWANAEGTAGVNGNAKIMACRWMAENGAIANVVRAYGYVIEAKKQGVPVVAANNSWGSAMSSVLYSPLIATVVNLAGEEGIVSCFAAGNASLNHDGFTNQAHHSPYIITVGAMNSTGANAWFSDYGKTSVDVFAPGTQILAATSLQPTVDQMPAMYLPWIDRDKSLQGTFVFEDFEDGSDAVRISDFAGTAAAREKSGGYASDKARELDLSGLSVGKEVGFQISIPLKTTENPAGAEVPSSEEYYLAFEADVSGFTFQENATETSPVMQMRYLDASGEWKKPSVEVLWREIDGNWSVCSRAIPAADMQAMVEAAATRGDNCITMRFDGVVASVADAPMFYIDNVGLGTETSKYYYADGTSMATPCTAGVVSLVAGSRGSIPKSGAEALDVIARVKGSVVRTGKLDDVCITKGLVQATAMLATDEEMNPVPETVVANGDGTACIEGSFFGAPSGMVRINGVEAEVVSWSDKSIAVTIPADTPSGLVEYDVTRADGKNGRNFDVFDDAYGYVDLPVPTSTYIGSDGHEVPATGLLPLRIAATDDGVMAVLGDSDGVVGAFQFYSFETEEWQDVPCPEGLLMPGLPYECLTAMTAGKNEVYALMSSGDILEAAEYLLTYDTSAREWVYCTKLDSSFGIGELLALDNEGRLLTALGMSNADTRVYQVFPDTGVCSQMASELPDELLSQSGGALLISGDTQIAAGINGGALDRVYEKTAGVPSSDPFVFNGTDAWVKSKTSFFNNTGGSYTDPSKSQKGLDANQILVAAYGAIDGGFIMAGPARDIATPNFVDTWVYDAKTDSYTALDARADATRMQLQAGTVRNSTFYVLGVSGLDRKMIFRSLDLEAYGYSNTDASVNASREPESAASTALGGVWLDSEEGGFYVLGDDGVLTHKGASASNYQVAFDSETNTITLNDFVYTGTQSQRIAEKRSSLFSKKDLTIALKGTNEINGAPTDPGAMSQSKEMFGIYGKGSITFVGDGDLTVKTGDSGMKSSGVAAAGDIVFAGTGTIECVGQHVTDGMLSVLGIVNSDMSGIETPGTVEVRSGTVIAEAEGLTPSYFPSALGNPSDLSAIGIRAGSLLTSGNAALTASAGDILTLRNGTSVGVETQNAPVFATSTVVCTHGTAKKAFAEKMSMENLSEDEQKILLNTLYLNGSLNFAEMKALAASDVSEWSAFFAEKLSDDGDSVLTAAAYTVAPAAEAGLKASAWFGASESEALAAGEKTLDELAENLDASYTKVAAAHEHAWGPWQPYSDEQHMRICASDPSHIEYAAHEFGDDGICATCGFERPADPKKDNPDPAPSTGDGIPLASLLVLLAASGAAVAIARMRRCKR